MDNQTSDVGEREQSLFRTLAKILFLATGLVILIWFSHLTRHVLLASLLALILALALNWPVQWLEQKNVSRALGTLLSFVVVLLVSAFVGWLVVPRLGEEIPTLIEQVPELLESLVEQISDFAGDAPAIEQQLERVVDWVFGLFDELWQYTDVFFGAILLGIFVIALALYLVVNLRPLMEWYLESMPPHLRDPATRAFARSSRMVIGWVVATFILGGIKAVAAFIFLTAVGIPGAVVWSVLAFFGALVPQVGFYVMTIPPVIMAFAQDPLLALWTLLYYAAFSEFLGRFVAPQIYAETMEMNAAFVLFMIIAVGYGFGVVGVLISVPVAGFVKAYYDEFYLARQPEVDQMDDRVKAMMDRNVRWKDESSA